MGASKRLFNLPISAGTPGSASPPSKFNKIQRKLLSYFCRQKRCWLATAVILVSFLVLEHYPAAQRNTGAILLPASDLIEEVAGVLPEKSLGGPVNLSSSLVAPAWAGVDFTADDQEEDQDAVLIQDASLVSLNSPIEGDVFAGLRREVITYLVQAGDTPFDIAAKFFLNTDTVLWANNLRESDLIRPGDKLLILPINGVRVKVAKNDTLASLAKKYSGKAEEIIAFNQLSADGQLAIDSFLIIPNGEMPAPPLPKIIAPRYARGTPLPAGDWLIAPTSGYSWGRLHGRNGVDISAPCGTPIYAAASGRVILADSVGWNWGYGKYTQIQHQNGVLTLYSHTSRLLVEVGQTVEQGQLIALMGTTGRSTGCHLHFEVRGAANPLISRKR